MSITDVLRGYASMCEDSVRRTSLDLIADRIEEEHERAMAEQHDSLTVDMKPMTDENMAEHGWVRLPVDADGEYVHVGDVMVYADGNTCPMKVVALVPPAVFLTEDGPRYADMCHHHHELTVEDVLVDFFKACQTHASELGFCTDESKEKAWRAIAADYAEKLQMREE